MECLTSLVGLKEICATESGLPQPLFWLDDAQGIDRDALAQLAKPSNGTGKQFATDIIESSARILVADIESLIPKGYSIKSSLNSFCNTCSYTGVTSSSPKTGIIVNNISRTTNAYLSIDSLKVMIAETGDFTIVLDDGIAPKNITHSFTAGTEVLIINIGFKTTATSVKIYFATPVQINAMSCPISRSCGCSGQTVQSRDITVKGLLNGAEFTTQYGFIPCASLVCSLDNIMCAIVNQQPRLFGLALFYRSVGRYFSEFSVTQRANRNASFKEKEKNDLATEYMNLYYERLRGSVDVKGISDNLAYVLNNLHDPCVECTRQVSTAWATG